MACTRIQPRNDGLEQLQTLGRKRWSPFSKPLQREWGSVPDWRGSGTLTSREDEIQSEERNGGYETQTRMQWAKALLQKLIRHTKRNMWTKISQNLRKAEVWRGAQYVNPRVCATMETLTYRKVKEVNTSLAKREVLRRHSFPPTVDNQYYALPPTQMSQSKELNKPDIFNPSKKLRCQTSFPSAPYDCFGIGTKRGLWGWGWQPTAQEDTQLYGGARVMMRFACLANTTRRIWRPIAPYSCRATLEKWSRV